MQETGKIGALAADTFRAAAGEQLEVWGNRRVNVISTRKVQTVAVIYDYPVSKAKNLMY